MVECSDILFVVRSVGERTERACIEALRMAGAPQENIVVVNETPFSESLRKTYRLGIESGMQWVYCVDADVIVRDDAIKQLMDAARGMPDAMLGLQGMMLDKLTCSIRAGGVHVYRCRYLPDAMSAIPGEGASMRPESSAIQALGAAGHGWLTLPYVTGVHDFGQFHVDVFRKCYLHASKHISNIPRLLPIWKRLAADDEDFRVAIAGLAAGMQASGPAYVDKKNRDVARAWRDSGFDEKADGIEVEGFGPAEVEAMLENWAVGDVVVREMTASRQQIISAGADFPSSLLANAARKFRNETESKGAIGALLCILGTSLSVIGQRMQVLSRRFVKIDVGTR